MNYQLFLDTESKQLLAKFEQNAELRPVIGDTIRVRNLPTLYKITRQEPTGNPALNQTINYFARILNSSPDSRTMGRDIAKLTRTMRHLGR